MSLCPVHSLSHATRYIIGPAAVAHQLVKLSENSSKRSTLSMAATSISALAVLAYAYYPIVSKVLGGDDAVSELESQLKSAEVETLEFYKEKFGAYFRYKATVGRETVLVMDKDLSTEILKTKQASFYPASLQSKRRFGLQNFAKDDKAMEKLSKLFWKGLNHRSIRPLLKKRTEEVLGARINQMHHRLHNENQDEMNLSELIHETLLATNVDVLFGDGVYSKSFFEDWLVYRDSIAVRGTSGRVGESKKAHESKVKAAKTRLAERIREARTSSSSNAIPLVKDLQPALDLSDDEADILAMLFLWAANINIVPSANWIVAYILHRNNEGLVDRLRQEKKQAEETSGSSERTHAARPLLSSVIAETLRMVGEPHMFRVVTEDVQVSTKDKKTSVDLKKGEWVGLYPRFFAHFNPEVYEEPNQFQADRFAMESRCPFRAGNANFRAFGGGSAPCPGKDFAIDAVKYMVDQLLLDDRWNLSLANPTKPLPDRETQSVATPWPTEEIPVKFHLQ